MTRALLWDLDGTLLTTARAGVLALEDAAREVCGVNADFSSLATSGLTDSEVAEAAIDACRASTDPATVSAFLREYERRLPARLPLREGAVLPGVRETLEAVVGRSDVLSLLLTGNTEAGARAKLRHYKLDRYFDGGAFCFDGDNRKAIAVRAMKVVAERLGRKVDPNSVFVIGDTPHDLRAARAIGARSVLLATGSHDVAELEALGAWRVFERLPSPRQFLRLIDSTGQEASAA